ncbi:MAG TPA: DEAD/DEAH box helicase family protein, partial [Gemmatimonadales bacterium]|nr:DEAD/DEAH box helicase family protein [Gemmatimonadales bacterium]
MLSEADTCRTFVVPKLQETGWDTGPCQICEQVTFTDGRIVVTGRKGFRRPGKRVDYLLRYRSDIAIAVVEAKASYKSAHDGLQQAKDYAELLGLKFAYATNGYDIIEFDYLTGRERGIADFPSPAELWQRLTAGEKLTGEASERILAPTYVLTGKALRYYQETAVNRTVQAIAKGKRRVLLTMATGTGKTLVAFQICWKLTAARWSRAGEVRRPRILYLSDRNILIDDPKDKMFAPFADARHKIENGVVTKSR